MCYLILNSSPSRICLFSQKTLVWISGNLSSTPGFVWMSSMLWASIWTLQRIPCSHMKVKGGWRLVYCCSVAQSCPNLCDSMDRNIPGSLSFTISWSLLRLMSVELVMPSNYLVLCCPLFLLPSLFPSIRVFSNEQLSTSGGQSIGASVSVSVLPMNIQFISFRSDWFDLLAVQETLRSLLQYHN